MSREDVTDFAFRASMIVTMFLMIILLGSWVGKQVRYQQREETFRECMRTVNNVAPCATLLPDQCK